MELVIAYAAAPLLLGAILLGAGLLVAVTQRTFSFGPVTAPVGLALVVLVGSVTTFTTATAPYTTVAISLVAAIGYVLALLRSRDLIRGGFARLDPWPGLVALAAFASFAAPVAMSGRASWAGWVKLDDSASWLAFTDQLMAAGKTVPVPVTSTFERLIDVNFRGNGGPPYPTGAFPPLGVMSQLTGVDIAWLLHPYMCVLGALLALVTYHLLRTLIAPRWLRALTSVIAAQAATVFAYVLWGGLKEILLPVLLAVLSVTAVEATRRGSTWRALVPPTIATLAFYTVTGSSGIGYVGPVLVAALLLGWIIRRPYSGAIATAAIASALATAAVLLAVGAVPKRLALVPEIPDIGNLVGPLNPWQAAGVWPTGDFRFPTAQPTATALLIAVVAALAALGIVSAVRRRSWALVFYAGSATLVLTYSQFSGGAWLAGKATAVASPAVLACAFAGAGWLLSSRPVAREAPVHRHSVTQLVGATAVALVVGGVLWSNTLAYKAVWLAPADQQSELEAIGHEFAGQGPALMTDFATFGGRHFLRDLDTEVAAELRVNQIPLRDGTIGQKGESFDVSAFPPSTLEAYPLLVLRRSPTGSRPPATYEMARAGTYYDVWRRIPGTPGTPADVALAGLYAVAPDAACDAITGLAQDATSGSSLVAAPMTPATVLPLGAGPLPAGWTANGDGASVTPAEAGSVILPVDIPVSGTYEVWVAGSYPGQLIASVDGAPIAEGRSMVEPGGSLTTSLGRVNLEAGPHQLTLDYTKPWWRPGTDSGPFSLGPVYLTDTDADRSLISVPVDQATGLCGRDLSWVSVAPPS